MLDTLRLLFETYLRAHAQFGASRFVKRQVNRTQTQEPRLMTAHAKKHVEDLGTWICADDVLRVNVGYLFMCSASEH
jgi:hypothetical protein